MFFKKKKKFDPTEEDQHNPSAVSTWIHSFWMSPVDLAGEFLDLYSFWRRTRHWRDVLAVLPVLFIALVKCLVPVIDCREAFFAARPCKNYNLSFLFSSRLFLFN